MQQKRTLITSVDHIQTLMDFGLSYLQANVYLNLVKLEVANVQMIAKASNVARQDVYRVMPILLEMGLGEKIIAKPTMYKASPLRDGLSVLLLRRKDEYAELQKKKKHLLDNFCSDNEKISLQEETTQFKITSEMTLLLNMHRRLIQNVNNSMDVILPLITKPAKLCEEWSYIDEVYKTRKNVNIRLITNEPTKELQAIANNATLKIRSLATPILFGMHIFDNKEATLSISQESGLPCLWSNNPNVIMLAHNYFEALWNSTLKA
jgi:sugar-specific transcriptional regulator TrmB